MPIIKKTLYLLFYFFIFLLPLQTRWIFQRANLNGVYWEYGAKSLYATEILLGIIFFLAIIYLIKANLMTKRNNFRLITKKDLAIVLFLIIGFVLPIIFAFDKNLAFYKMIFMISGLALLLFVVVFKPDIRKSSYFLVASGLMQSGIAIIQFIQQKIIASTIFGVAAQDPLILGTSVIESNGERILRGYGTLMHPNILGGFLAICLLITIGLYLAEKSSQKKIVLLISFIVSFSGLLISASRSAYAGLFGGLIFLIILMRKNSLARKSLTQIIVIIFLLTAIFTSIWPQFISSRITGAGRLEEKSINERLTGYKDAGQILKSNWLTGVGYGNYTLALSQIKLGLAAHAYQPIHNAFLLTIIETGVAGILFICFAIIFIIRKIQKKILIFNREIFTLVFLASIISLAIIGLFDHWIASFYFGIMLIFLTAGLLLQQLSNQQTKN